MASLSSSSSSPRREQEKRERNFSRRFLVDGDIFFVIVVVEKYVERRITIEIGLCWRRAWSYESSSVERLYLDRS